VRTRSHHNSEIRPSVELYSAGDSQTLQLIGMSRLTCVSAKLLVGSLYTP
jgi:hypothetical protein